jgi:hypothetical protein
MSRMRLILLGVLVGESQKKSLAEEEKEELKNIKLTKGSLDIEGTSRTPAIERYNIECLIVKAETGSKPIIEQDGRGISEETLVFEGCKVLSPETHRLQSDWRKNQNRTTDRLHCRRSGSIKRQGAPAIHLQ